MVHEDIIILTHIALMAINIVIMIICLKAWNNAKTHSLLAHSSAVQAEAYKSESEIYATASETSESSAASHATLVQAHNGPA